MPCYQHSQFIDSVLDGLKDYDLPVIVVNDGSDSEHTEVLKKIDSEKPWVSVIHHKKNQGKGGAVKTALREAHSRGFSHALQVDSDGQHELVKVKDFLRLSQKSPNSVISGEPQFDESIPSSRLYGRKFTQMWVTFETLSTDIKDSMCGFRIYPLKQAIKVLDTYKLGQKMDFDIEFLVKFYWQGVDIDFLPVKVNYPEEGVSHFNLFNDNWLITKMHTRLMFGMLFRLPKLLWRKKKDQSHWAKINERGGHFALTTVFWIYKVLGFRVISWLVKPVVFYFYLFAKKARAHSKNYIEIYKSYCKSQGVQSKKISSHSHFQSFGQMAVDKMAVWHDDLKFEQLNQNNVAELNNLHDENEGRVFISSHYGNIEICRAMSANFPYIKINALMYQSNAKHFFKLLNRLNVKSTINVIYIDKFGIDLAMRLQEKVAQGEWIFILADRESVGSSQHSLECDMLGQKVSLPKGPFLLASLLKVPSYVFHCFKGKNKFNFRIKPLINQQDMGKRGRRNLDNMAQVYADELQELVLNDPHQWYNFFNFWK